MDINPARSVGGLYLGPIVRSRRPTRVKEIHTHTHTRSLVDTRCHNYTPGEHSVCVSVSVYDFNFICVYIFIIIYPFILLLLLYASLYAYTYVI